MQRCRSRQGRLRRASWLFDREATIAETAKLTALGEDSINFQNRYRHRDGTYRWLEWMVRPDESSASLYAVARDITARHEGEERL
ncbi:MAG: PAS domain S-box protein, partial [Gaiella sp.]